MRTSINKYEDPTRGIEVSRIRAAVKARGMRWTKQRQALMDAFFSGKPHITPEEYFRAVHKGKPSISKATVYRMLKLLTSIGMAQKMELSRDDIRYEVKPPNCHHDHLICVRCGRIMEFSSSALEALQKRLARNCGFKVLHHRHELFGYCKKCQLRKG